MSTYVSFLPSNSLILPSQIGNAGKYLTTDGTTLSWGTPVSQTITLGVLDKSPSEDAVAQALALKVTGAASATDGTIALFDGVTGKMIRQGLGWTIDSGALCSQVDGTYNIGKATDNRPGYVYVKTTINLDSLTASAFVGSNASKNLVSLSSATATSYLNTFTSLLQGVVPASGGGTTNFLRADGTWAAVSAGMTNPMTTAGDIIVGGASGTPNRLALGAVDKVLVSDGTTVTYQYAGLGGGNLGTNNIFLGRGYNNTGFTPGTDNVVIGLGTGPGNSLGGCVIIGNRAGAANGINNAVAIGIEAAGNNPTALNAVAVGYQALYKNADHSDSVGVGFQAGYNTTGALAVRNAYLGFRTGFNGGLYNSAVGYGACGTSQSYCQAVGYESLGASTGDANTAIGFSALKSVNGNYNIGVGNRAGLSASGSYGLFIGNYAGSQSVASNEFYLSNLTAQLANNALEKTNSLMYGTFNSATSSQTLALNAQVTATYGISVSTAGYGLSIKSGANAKIGKATITSPNSSVTVNTTAVTANSVIFLTGQNGTDAFSVNNIVAGTSFDIVHSGSVTATVAWMIVEAV